MFVYISRFTIPRPPSKGFTFLIFPPAKLPNLAQSVKVYHSQTFSFWLMFSVS